MRCTCSLFSPKWRQADSQKKNCHIWALHSGPSDCGPGLTQGLWQKPRVRTHFSLPWTSLWAFNISLRCSRLTDAEHISTVFYNFSQVVYQWNWIYLMCVVPSCPLIFHECCAAVCSQISEADSGGFFQKRLVEEPWRRGNQGHHSLHVSNHH